MNEPTPIQFSDLPREVQRRLTAAFEKDRLAPRPLRQEMNGAVRVDAKGSTFAIAKDGSMRRVHIAEDGIYAVKKWSKAQRKRMRAVKRRTRAGASGTPAQQRAE